MPNILAELEGLRRERSALKHKSARITQSRDHKRRVGLVRQVEQAERRLEVLRQVVLHKQASERTPVYFRRSYQLEQFLENLTRIKHVT